MDVLIREMVYAGLRGTTREGRDGVWLARWAGDARGGPDGFALGCAGVAE
jgi:hypothetical protein